ncbi:SUKH-4 family immunity protein [Streptacidiphilus melanogenes]|uniref:SUKH-4 family immunity protein n=1 Tax=Streptacidiphilus melanogenes TaxID=411235 RepID=UPI0005AAD63D|nr:SUKH-4 family immunity protein [Streptacidiphilus melanogenes]
MLFPLTSDDLASLLPPEQVVLADRSVAEQVIGRADAVAFLSEVGVPRCSGLFEMDASLAVASTPEDFVVDDEDTSVLIETSSLGQLASLGCLQDASVYVRRSDGAVFAPRGDEDGDEDVEQLNADVSSFAKLLLLIETKSPDPALGYADALPLYSRAAREIKEEMTAVDPAPFAHSDGFWTGYLDSFAGGLFPRESR